MALFGGIQLPGHPDLENIRRLDLLPTPQIRRMQRVGIALDRQWLWDLSSRLAIKAEGLKRDITECIPPEALQHFIDSDSDSDVDLNLNVNSATQIAKLLFDVLGVGKQRRLKTTADGKRVSTGKKQLETLKRDHPVIPLILQYRETVKLKSTYTDALPRLARLHPRGHDCPLCGRYHPEDHYRIHTEIVTTRTETGRLASRHPNLQNIPARTKEGREVRKAFIPQVGYRLVGNDYAQIELRKLADSSQDPNMLRIFREGGDIHLDTACRAFNLDVAYYSRLAELKERKELDEKQAEEWAHFALIYRAPCKNVNFGVAYGLGPEGLYDLMAVTYATAGLSLPDWLDVDWCANFIQKWFNLYPQCFDYFELQKYRARRYRITWSRFGGVRRIPEVRSEHERVRQAGLRQGCNNPIQRDAAETFKLGMARAESNVFVPWREAGIDAWALIPIHDELLAEVPEEQAEQVGELYGYEMSEAMRDEDTGEYCSRVPIATDGHTMDRWSKE